MTASLEIRSPRGEIRFADTVDHFDNGVLRLLSLDRAGFERWIALSEEENVAEGDLARLTRGFARLMATAEVDSSGDVEAGPGGLAGEVLHASITENPAFGVARSRAAGLGWLVRREGHSFVRVTDAPVYEESYFEGDLRAGYGSYSAQSGWRLEKAARQLREIREATGLSPSRALDVGSGYGFFRKALSEAGIANEGIEISAHARAVARELYGQETLDRVLSTHVAALAGRFDLVTLWDVVEHVADPVALLEEVRSCLRPGGVVAIRTPNLDCPEADVFGAHYHSLKREHLVYFTPSSLAKAARDAALDVVSIVTTSHLLAGFVGEAQVRAWGRDGRGADITAFLRRADGPRGS